MLIMDANCHFWVCARSCAACMARFKVYWQLATLTAALFLGLVQFDASDMLHPIYHVLQSLCIFRRSCTACMVTYKA